MSPFRAAVLGATAWLALGRPGPSPAGAGPLAPGAVSKTGTYSALVIFARFADEAPGDTTKPEWADDLFDPRRPGSFAHFYDEMSGGRLQVRGQALRRRYVSADPAATYLAAQPGERGDFARFNLDILTQADADTDFGRFDNDGPDGVPNSGDDDGYVDIVFVNLLTVPRDFLISSATGIATLGLSTDYLSDDPAAGGGVVRVRSESSGFGGTTQRGHTFTVTAATMCHEFGHVLGLPDLFDQSSVSSTGELDPVEDSAGIGKWGLMGLGTLGWGVEDGPNAFSAWSLAQLGWLGGRLVEVDASRQGVELAPIDRGGRVLKIPVTPDEYFLVENRQAGDSYYNRNIPAGGLLVWHVDEHADNDEERHKRVDLVCADGLFADRGFPGRRPDPVGGGDNLDFWARDAAYATAHNGNQGDATDPFDGVRFRRLAWDTNPGARAYAGGYLGVPLGFALQNITPLGDGRMRLDVLIRRPLAGHVHGDTTWSGRVDVTGDVVVDAGAVLTLAAGTEVRFAAADARRSGFDTTRCELIVYGDLRVEGTTRSPVVLTRADRRGDWLGVLLPGAAATRLDGLISSGALVVGGARLGVAGARLGPGLTRWSGNRRIPWDVVVPGDALLEIAAGTRVRFAPHDLSGRGERPGAAELIVEGELAIRGQAIRPVVLTVDADDPKALWGGVRLGHGAAFDAQGATITQALVGVAGPVAAPFRLADSQLFRLVNGLRLTLFADATVERVTLRTITAHAVDVGGAGTLLLHASRIEGNGREGVSVRNAGLQVRDTRITGNGILDVADPRSGLVARGGRGQRLEVIDCQVEGNRLHGLLADGWEGELQLRGGAVSGNGGDGVRAQRAQEVVLAGTSLRRNGGAGVRLAGVVSTVRGATFAGNAGGGLLVVGGRPRVEDSRFEGDGVSLTNVADATVHTSTFTGAAVALSTDGAPASVRANRFTGNDVALRVRAAPVPVPVRGNIFIGNTVGIDNRSDVVVDARGNYWGTTDPRAIEGLVSGAVEVQPWLEGEPPLTAVVDDEATTPQAFALHPAWPNPFNGATTIAFDLPAPAVVELTVYDLLGRRVRRLQQQRGLPAGRFRLTWAGRDEAGRPVGSGIYLYRLHTDRGQAATGRVLLVR